MPSKPTSLLWPSQAPPTRGQPDDDFFVDLQLQEILDAVAAPASDYGLDDWYRSFPGDARIIRHRQEVLKDLLRSEMRQLWRQFTAGMQDLRRQVRQAETLYHQRQRQRVFLDVISRYHHLLRALNESLAASQAQSGSLRAVQEAVAQELERPERQTLEATTETLASELDSLHFDLQVSGSHVALWRQGLERDLDEEIKSCFAHFLAAPATADRTEEEPEGKQANLEPVEAQILDAVAELFPDTFARLAEFHAHWVQAGEKATPAAISALDLGRYPFVFLPLLHWEREIQFFLAYLDYLAPLQASGLPICVPDLAETKECHAQDVYDLALAQSLRQEQGQGPVLNDLDLQGPERILLVSGPNQGGKTTYARCFGQLHYLAGLGLPVAARHAQLFVCDAIYTQFERHEDARSGHSKLEADLRRLQRKLAHATPRSLFILNELFHSTTLADARFLSTELLARLRKLDVLALWVSFLDELSRAGPDVVSILSIVDSEDDDRREFRLRRQAADGLAYALSLARKYGLDYQQLLDRIRDAAPSS